VVGQPQPSLLAPTHNAEHETAWNEHIRLFWWFTTTCMMYVTDLGKTHEMS